MNNYKINIQYDGTNYCGWQIQNNHPTIQQTIVNKIELISKVEVNLTGSGRTDTGVHALGQVANFKLDKEIDAYRFSHSLNAVLPKDISITGMEKVDESFNARFDAKKRSYIYIFSSFKSPFYQKYSYHYHNLLDCNLLNKLSSALIGTKNFTSFTRKNTETKNKVCNIFEARWRESRGLTIFFIEADRFLHGMVRTVIGTLLRSAKLGQSVTDIEEILTKEDREAAGEAVPPNGLFLYKVKY